MVKPIRTGALALGLAAGLVAAHAQSPSQRDAPPQSAAPGPLLVPVATETLVFRGTVRAIDAGTRTVTIEGAEGGTSTLMVGEGLRNFDNLKVGDRVEARYTEAVAHSIVEAPQNSGIRQRIEADAARQAPAGGRPGLQAVERVTVVANVVDVDRAQGRVTLRGIEREPMQVRVPEGRMLDGLERGDQVVVTYAQSSAISIEPGSPTASR